MSRSPTGPTAEAWDGEEEQREVVSLRLVSKLSACARVLVGGGTCTHHSVRAPPKDALLEVVDRLLALSGARKGESERKERRQSVARF